MLGKSRFKIKLRNFINFFFNHKTQYTMKQVVLNEEQLKALDAFLQELPMKYGAPIVNFLNEAIKSQEAEAIKAE